MEHQINWTSPISKRKPVSIHGNFLDKNFLFSDKSKKKLNVIGLQSMWVGTPLADLATVSHGGKKTYEYRKEIFKHYLGHLKKETGDEKEPGDDEVRNLMFDAELYKFFAPMHGFFSQLSVRCPKFVSEWNSLKGLWLKVYAEWETASKSFDSKTKLNELGIWQYLEKNPAWRDFADSSCGSQFSWLKNDWQTANKLRGLW